jgi:hypothetical protein
MATHKLHDENCNCEKDLHDLVGTTLAKKLTSETVRAVEVTEKELADLLTAAMKTRSGLLADDLSHLPAHQREAALAQLNVRQAEMLLCGLLRLASTMSLAAGDTMADFVGHAARHFEGETMSAVVNALDAQSARKVNDAAVAFAGKDN